MMRLRRGPRVGHRETPAGAYEVQFRLEESYRWLGLIFTFVGAIGFFLAIVSGHLLLLFLTGPAFGAGVWIWWKDPREYLAVDPRRRRLQLLRVYGRTRKVRADADLRKVARLELAHYVVRPKGPRAMILLVMKNGTLEKLDDRPDDPGLVAICEELAAAAHLEFVDRGRIDLDPPAGTLRATGDEGAAEVLLKS